MTRYLLVDDSPTVRLTLASAIRNARKGAPQIVEAGDAASALAEFRANLPDVVFLDMMLPAGGLQGSEVLTEMLRIHPAAKVVLVTGLGADDPQVKASIASGAFAFVPKPTRTEAIRKVLNDIETEAGRFGRIR